MAEARRIWRLQLGVGLTGLLATAAALLAATSRIDFGLPSLPELAVACQRYGVAQLRPATASVLLIGSLSLAAVSLALRSAVRQLGASRRLERSLMVRDRLRWPRRARVFAHGDPHAFCVGLLRPRIYVSSAAVELLREDELTAVLSHEAEHARRRDPLRLLLARALAEGLFFLPVVRRLSERYAALAEIAADEAAASRPSGRAALASALLAFDAHPSPAAVGIAPERVDHLLGRRPCWDLPIVLVLGAAATIGLLVAVTIRMADATSQAAVGLPVLAAQACMLAVAAGPLVVGAIAMVGGRRVLRRRAR